ncbi:fibronectin type III domain-containing protein [Arenivirga flava]|uniref:fibronectin type III domain-containing protein n=1 Tax=Arenivirga flava TaxID=1930060 RepID=UPI0024E0E75B|nr:fibronectin type III domain-containing protein [Arenivirga flava]
MSNPERVERRWGVLDDPTIVGAEAWAVPVSGGARIAAAEIGRDVAWFEDLDHSLAYDLSVVPTTMAGPGVPASVRLEAGRVPTMMTYSPMTIAGDANSLTIRWLTTPFDGGRPLSGQQIQVRELPDGAWMAHQMAGPRATEAVLTGLKRGVGYEIRVAGVNILGVGDPSQPLTTTFAGTPSQPRNFGFSAHDGAIKIDWHGVDDPAGEVTDYLVRWSSPQFVEEQSVRTSEGRLRIGGLENGLPVRVSVQAVNSNGPGIEDFVVLTPFRFSPFIDGVEGNDAREVVAGQQIAIEVRDVPAGAQLRAVLLDTGEFVSRAQAGEDGTTRIDLRVPNEILRGTVTLRVNFDAFASAPHEVFVPLEVVPSTAALPATGADLGFLRWALAAVLLGGLLTFGGLAGHASVRRSSELGALRTGDGHTAVAALPGREHSDGRAVA